MGNPGECSRQSRCRAQEAGASSVFHLKPWAKEGERGGDGTARPRSRPCGGVGHDKGFGFFLVAVVSQGRVLSQEMPLI